MRRARAGRRRGGRPRAVACALAVALCLPVAPAAGQEEPDAQESDAQEPDAGELRDDLEANDEALAAAQQRLDAARAVLAEAERREAAAAQELDVLIRELQAARQREAEATARARDRAGDLATDPDLLGGRAVVDDRRADLEHRVVWMWKHGAVADAALQVRIAAGARNPHDLVVGRRVVDHLVEGSRTARDEAQAVLEAAITGRATRIAGRDDARRDAFEASVQAGTIELLERRQAVVIEQLRAAREEQQAVFAAIESDRDALAALSRQLRQALASISMTGALVPPADLPLDGPPPPWVDALPQAGRSWATAVDAIAVRHGLDGALFTALVWSESGFHPFVVSHAGAIGLSQLMPGTANGLGVDPWDPFANLAGGARYLRAQIERFGAVDLGLAAYNAGPGRVQRAGNRIPDIAETQLYVIRVLERWELLRGAS